MWLWRKLYSVTTNFFNLLNIPEQFVIDLEKLNQHYQTIQKEIHPDRFASTNKNDQLQSVKKTAELNVAYQTLKSPLRRAEYLLHIHGLDMMHEKNTAVSQDFLMQQMEWREELETHKKNKASLEALSLNIQKEKKEILHLLPECFKKKNDLHEAIEMTRKLNFIEKIEQHISDALIEIK